MSHNGRTSLNSDADGVNSQLCHSHIVTTSQRSPPARIVALLSSDLREFIASGMLTLKAKFDTLEESKVVSRAAEVWSFFWAQVLPVSFKDHLRVSRREIPLMDFSTWKGSSCLLPNYEMSPRMPHPAPPQRIIQHWHYLLFLFDISFSPGSCYISFFLFYLASCL